MTQHRYYRYNNTADTGRSFFSDLSLVLKMTFFRDCVWFIGESMSTSGGAGTRIFGYTTRTRLFWATRTQPYETKHKIWSKQCTIPDKILNFLGTWIRLFEFPPYPTQPESDFLLSDLFNTQILLPAPPLMSTQSQFMTKALITVSINLGQRYTRRWNGLEWWNSWQASPGTSHGGLSSAFRWCQ